MQNIMQIFITYTISTPLNDKYFGSILGHFHQGCLIFHPYNGMQCTAVALIALLTFMKCANNTSFESRDLDEIIVEGTSLYRENAQEYFLPSLIQCLLQSSTHAVLT
jgi:hypothetical protein